MRRYFYILLLINSLILLNTASACAEQTAAEYLHLGNVSSRQDNYKDAISNYNKALEKDPNLVDAYYNRGYVYIETRKYKLAIADLDKAIELNPNYAAAFHVRGIAYFLKKKYKQAIADYSKAIELDPDNIKFYDSRMSANFKLNDYDKVWKDIIKIQGLGGTVNPVIMNLLKDKKYRDNP